MLSCLLYTSFAFKPGLQEDVSLSIRGGTDKVRYYVLANYFSQGGNYKYSNAGEYDSQTKFTRYNFRSNIDININRYLSTLSLIHIYLYLCLL